MRRSTLTRAVGVALVAAAIGPLGATSAGAATVVDDFTKGTNDRTAVTASGVQLRPALDEAFDGTVLPTGWTSTPWSGGTGTSTVSGGVLTVNGARADSGVAAGPGSVLAFRAAFTAEAYQHVGFGTTFEGAPWAMFSTGSDGLNIYARTYRDDNAGGKSDPEPVVIPGPPDGTFHDYRIAWTTSGFDFYIDNVLKRPEPIAILAPTAPAPPMRPQISDLSNDPINGTGTVKVESMKLTNAPASGTYTSSVLDAGSAAVTGVTLDATATTPAGTTAAFETHSGTTGTPDASWSDWTPLGSAGAVASPARRYLQYRVTLTTNDAVANPAVSRVAANFAVDDQGPATSITDVAVAGTSATATFRSDDATATYQCRVDGAAFAACTSPATAAGLAPGTHAFDVRGTDTWGNVGAVASRSFTVNASTTASGATGASGGSGGAGAAAPGAGSSGPVTGTAVRDKLAPKVVISPRSVRVSSSGRVTLKVKCPAGETSCLVVLRLKLNGSTVAKTTTTIGGGRTVRVALTLSGAARAKLAKRSSLKVSASAQATDAAGNRKVTTTSVTLKRPLGVR
jgi:hypothetical protein